MRFWKIIFGLAAGFNFLVAAKPTDEGLRRLKPLIR